MMILFRKRSRSGNSNRAEGLFLAALLGLLAVLLWSHPDGVVRTVSSLETSLAIRGDSTASLAPVKPGIVLWSDDLETGDLSKWSLPDISGGRNAGGGVFNTGGGVANVEQIASPHSGLYAARLFIDTTQNQGGPTTGTRLFRWLEPQKQTELYYSVWFYIPHRYTPDGEPSWWNVFQWKSRHKHASSSDPFFALNIGNRSNGSMYFYLYDASTKRSYGQAITDIPEGRWLRLEAFYKCSADKLGEVSFWQDGVQIFDIPGIDARYPDGDCAWSVNNYSSSLDPPQASIFIDDAAICLGGRCP